MTEPTRSGTCNGCGQIGTLTRVPRIGLYCETCIVKLSRPMLFEGAVSGIPMVDKATAFDNEVLSRTARYKAQAKAICQQ